MMAAIRARQRSPRPRSHEPFVLRRRRELPRSNFASASCRRSLFDFGPQNRRRLKRRSKSPSNAAHAPPTAASSAPASYPTRQDRLVRSHRQRPARSHPCRVRDARVRRLSGAAMVATHSALRRLTAAREINVRKVPSMPKCHRSALVARPLAPGTIASPCWARLAVPAVAKA
jgi:hypothetical protein